MNNFLGQALSTQTKNNPFFFTYFLSVTKFVNIITVLLVSGYSGATSFLEITSLNE